ncbi:MAG: hypothetical protein J0I80_01145 [Sphingomonas sp.]|nr:hypothetical protein [Sphingomonas sp.]
MSHRTRMFLVMAAITLFVFDGLFLAALAHRSFTSITYVGLDSFALAISDLKGGAIFLNGRWQHSLQDAEAWTEDMSGRKRKYWIVRLAPMTTYGHFLASVRDLKVHNKCNVAIAESADVAWAGKLEADLGIVLVLCGSSIGDAGFAGELPNDRAISF